jgi:hypothetical protein
LSNLFRKSVNLLEKAAPRRLFALLYGPYACIKNVYNLLIRYGLLKSSFSWQSVDRNGGPIPWFTYPALEYLDGLDLSALSVFEYGSGNSTAYWSRRARTVTAVEHDPEWAHRVQPLLSDNACIKLVTSDADYPSTIVDCCAKFDVIVIDGSSRLECANAALPQLRPGGVIILDDADDHRDAAAALRRGGLIEVDFAGFSPINTYTKTTSFFLHRDFQPRPRGDDLPLHSLCHPGRGNQNTDRVGGQAD